MKHTTLTQKLLLVLFYLVFNSLNTFSTTLTLKPGPVDGKDAFLDQNTGNSNYGNHPELPSIAWNCSSNCKSRGLLQFDLSSIPFGSVITYARLSLYANPSPTDGGGIAMQGNNQSYLYRITSPWDENTVTWNSAPFVTGLNHVILTQSNSAFQDYLNIDVKNMVQDMINDPANSFGFHIRLSNEAPNTSMIFASSDFPNSALWPEITIEYDLPGPNSIITQAPNESSYCQGSNINVNYSIAGTFNNGNVFTAQLSSSDGSFSSPVSIGSVISVSAGSISVTFPLNTPYGNGYRIRVVSSDPPVIGLDENYNITIINPDDGDPCTVDYCDPALGTHIHTNVNVSDNVNCTIDACNPSTGEITHTPVNPDDGNSCTADGCTSTAQVFHTQTCNVYNANLKNIVFTDSRHLEFEIWLEWTGTNTQKFNFFQGGISFNYDGLANGGTLTGTFVTGTADPSLPQTQSVANWAIFPSTKLIRLQATFPSPASAAVPIPPPPGFRIGKFRITNTVDFTPFATPNFTWTFLGGSTFPSKISCYINTNTFSTEVTLPSHHFVESNPAYHQPLYLFSRLFIEGFYIGNRQMKPILSNRDLFTYGSSSCDSIFFDLHTPTAPYNIVASSKSIVDANGYVDVTFPSFFTNGFYYISFRHRNSIETWSKNPVFISSFTNYDFSTSASQAYGDNMKLTPDNLVWAAYSGDIDQDEAIDATDFLTLDPSIQNGDTGYLLGDLNGDGSVDATDFLILDLNVQNGIGKVAP